MVYLDNASWMQPIPAAMEAMQRFRDSGCPDSELTLQKNNIAKAICTEPEHLLFTVSGSAANKLLFRAMEKYLPETGRTHIVTSPIEHESVLDSAHELEASGFTVSYPALSENHRITPVAVRNVLQENTGFASIIYADNVTGTTNNIDPILNVCSCKGALTHTDAASALIGARIRVHYMDCDFLTISAHKIGGSDGIGALYVKDTDKFMPLLQEVGDDLLLGDSEEDRAKIVGFGVACSLLDDFKYMSAALRYNTKSHLHERELQWLDWEQDFFSMSEFFGIVISNTSSAQLSALLQANGVELGICAKDPGYEQRKRRVLSAMGFDEEYINRFVLVLQPPFMPTEDARYAAKMLANAIEFLYFWNGGDMQD